MFQYTLFDDEPPAASKRPTRNDIRNGDAAEALVLFKLLSWGFNAHDTRRDLPYDLAVDLGDQVCRVQVKARGTAARGRWHYRFVRGNPRTGAGVYRYSASDYDVTAVVAMSLEKVLFFPGVHPALRLTTADFLREGAEAESWRRAIQAIGRDSSVAQH